MSENSVEIGELEEKTRCESAPASLVPELLTLAQAAGKYGSTARTLLNWAQSGILETRWIGNALVTSQAAMAAALAQAPKRGRPRKPPAGNQIDAGTDNQAASEGTLATPCQPAEEPQEGQPICNQPGTSQDASQGTTAAHLKA